MTSFKEVIFSKTIKTNTMEHNFTVTISDNNTTMEIEITISDKEIKHKLMQLVMDNSLISSPPPAISVRGN
jgi:hypothetical protein